MVVSHKTRVVVQYLVPIAIAYFAIGTLLFTGATPKATELPGYLGGMAGLVVVGALVQDMVPKPFKEWLVFWRARDRLPGHRAFTATFERPDRFDHRKIKHWDDNKQLPPQKRQQLFYQIYRKHSKDIRVEHYSFRYLAWRDSASMLLLLALATVPAFGYDGNFVILVPAVKLAGIMAFVCLCAIFAARQAADELVCQVFSAAALGGKS